MIIVGAGLSGLITAYQFPKSIIVEKSAEPKERHKALLRFRSDKIAALTGIEFERVRVLKGIWIFGTFTKPTIQTINKYSRKCLSGYFQDRSISDIRPVERFIAPPDLYHRMVDRFTNEGRIKWGVDFEFSESAISTAPMPITLDKVIPELKQGLDFNFSDISVIRYRLPNAKLHQTIYYPSSNHSMYRASFTGDLLICEFVGQPTGRWIDELTDSFGIAFNELEPLEQASQQYGKIAPIDDLRRRHIIFELTQKHHIYSIGRFATWRNILLDDLIHDAAIVKKLIDCDHYSHKLLL